MGEGGHINNASRLKFEQKSGRRFDLYPGNFVRFRARRFIIINRSRETVFGVRSPLFLGTKTDVKIIFYRFTRSDTPQSVGRPCKRNGSVSETATSVSRGNWIFHPDRFVRCPGKTVDWRQQTTAGPTTRSAVGYLRANDRWNFRRRRVYRLFTDATIRRPGTTNTRRRVYVHS